jgi:hypothetical protein
MLTTPSGTPASCRIAARRRPDIGVSSASFMTTVQPDASTGASFHAAISSGKFQGMICATTPIGSLRVNAWYSTPGV